MARYSLDTTQEEAIYSRSDPRLFLEYLANSRVYKKLVKLVSKVNFSWSSSNYFKIAIGLLVLAGLPIYSLYSTNLRYGLNEEVSKIIGTVPQNLSKQITYDGSKNAYVFNAAGMKAPDQTVGPDKVPLSLLQAKIAGNKSTSKSLYSVVMPTDPKQGITYYDNNTGLSFQMLADFSQMSAKKVAGHVIYPISNDIQVAYSVKNNGLKEDIVLKKFISDSLIYRYNLKLPQTLEARMMNDGSGSLGIYSADPALFTGGSYLESDTAKLESAKNHAVKDNLVFVIPAPVIVQTGVSGQGRATAEFALSQDGKTLTISAEHLSDLNYPVSIDPTVVITSTSDFATGNNEDNISYPANQINRGSVTGGSIGSWTATTVLPASTQNSTSVSYNGYIYEIGGNSGSGYLTNVYYAPLNSNGTVGAWAAATSLPVGTDQAASVVYNGYLYLIGGVNTGGSTSTNVYFAPINSNGSLGSWTATTALSAASKTPTAVAYNGFLYEMGGWNGSRLATVNYAVINANGTIGAWTATTALSTATRDSASVVYNGYIYEIGGENSGGATSVVSYAPINADGSLGSWTATTSLPTAVWGATSVVYNGYAYSIAGFNGSVGVTTVNYAPINANGTLGSWTASSVLPATTYYASASVYNGYIYSLGGVGSMTTVNYAKIDPAGTTTSYSATTALPVGNLQFSSVAYNGYIYEIGGATTAGITSAVYYAPINANGTTGSWTATTSLPSVLYAITSVAYNGYLYVIGGGASAAVYYASINSNGTLGAWTTTTALTTATWNATSVAYNGYLYIIGGWTGSATAAVYYASINSNGTIGSWTATTSLLAATYQATSVVYNGYLYEIGGYNPSVTAAVYYASINSNGTIGSWTATTSLPAATRDATSVAYNGYIYEIGGANPSVTADVYYASINANGTIGAWAALNSLPTGTYQASSVIYNGYVYLLGGGTSGAPTGATTVYYARINNGGPGTVGAWATTTALPATIRDTKAVTYNGYIYQVGGYNGSAFVSTVYFAQIGASGTVGSWTATTVLPATAAKGQTVAYNDYLYYIGGYNGTANVNTVYYAPIKSDGSLGSWSTTTSLAAANEYGSAVAYNGYLYNLGGDNGTLSAAVYYAVINSNGTIGSWTSTTSLPVATNLGTAVVNNGYIYQIGGNTGSVTANVYFAQINSNGTIGSWTATTSLLAATSAATSVVYNGYLYEIGGWNGSTYYSTVSYAPFNANGGIGAWTYTTPLSTATNVSSSIVYNGYLYEIGGWNGSSTFSTVNYAPLNVMPRIGHFSTVINFRTLIMPVSITYAGNLPNISGTGSIQYRTAGASAVFGASQSAATLNVTQALCFNGTVQYMSVIATLDDSNSAAFPDVSSTPANVTDLSINYSTAHTSPSTRLRGGKTFISNSLTTLDTCNSPVSLTAPSAIGGLTTSQGAPAVTLSWTQATNTTTAPVEGIEVLKNGVVMATIKSTATAYKFTGLSSGAGTSYTFSVRPKNVIGIQTATPISITLYTATATPVTYSCPGGGTYQGTGTATGSCGQYQTAAAYYSCNSGGTYIGTGTAAGSCGQYLAAGYYSCPSGGSFNGSACVYEVTTWVGGYPTQAEAEAITCPDGQYMSGIGSGGGGYYKLCSYMGSYTATWNPPVYYDYPAATYNSAVFANYPVAIIASYTYSCPSGGTLYATECSN